MGFYSASPFLLAAGGKGESVKVGGGDVRERLQVWNTKTIHGVKERFASNNNSNTTNTTNNNNTTTTTTTTTSNGSTSGDKS